MKLFLVGLGQLVPQTLEGRKVHADQVEDIVFYPDKVPYLNKRTNMLFDN